MSKRFTTIFYKDKNGLCLLRNVSQRLRNDAIKSNLTTKILYIFYMINTSTINRVSNGWIRVEKVQKASSKTHV